MCKLMSVLLVCSVAFSAQTLAQEKGIRYELSKDDIDLGDVSRHFTVIAAESGHNEDVGIRTRLNLELRNDLDTSKLVCQVVVFKGKEALAAHPLKFEAEAPLRKGERVTAYFTCWPAPPEWKHVIRASGKNSK